jgi:simple sugar transport system ATP-binding protein
MPATRIPVAPDQRHDVPLVRVSGICKRFGGFAANDGVSFDVPRGAVLGLLGENGAGKSTIMNVLCGLYLPDAGRIEIDGQPLQTGAPRASIAAGVGMVHQQFRLVETLSGFENISLAIHRGRIWQPRRTDEAIRVLNEQLGFALDLALPVWQLSLARRQQLEILRTIAAGARILVLDEPTSVLSPVETEGLFDIVRRIAASGRSVILISHKLNEVLGVADHLVVMRGGRVVHAGPAADSDADTLARHIVGERQVQEAVRPATTPGEVALVARGLSVADHRGLPVVREVDLTLRRGELAALVGVTGNGQTELMEALGGLLHPSAGSIEAPRLGGRRHFGYIPARHLGTGLAPGLALGDNALLGHQYRRGFGAHLKRAAVEAHAREVTARFDVRIAAHAPVRQLSGGNLQRLVLGRELLGDPALILADYPTRGLDVASAAQIRAALIAAAEGGAAVLMSSEELEESLAMATRILVMHSGRIVADLAAAAADYGTIGRLMTRGAA